MSTPDISEMLGISISGAHKYVVKLMREKRIHKADNVANVLGRPRPFYAAGSGLNMEYSPKVVRKPKQPDRKESKISKIIELLSKPHTAQELGDKLFCSASRIRFYLKTIRKTHGVYIFDWKHPGKRGDHAPRYKLGYRVDAAKPPQPTRAERYKKEISDPDRLERILAKKRASHRASSATKKKAGPWAALGI